jgi:hypothetical protein
MLELARAPPSPRAHLESLIDHLSRYSITLEQPTHAGERRGPRSFSLARHRQSLELPCISSGTASTGEAGGAITKGRLRQATADVGKLCIIHGRCL